MPTENELREFIRLERQQEQQRRTVEADKVRQIESAKEKDNLYVQEMLLQVKAVVDRFVRAAAEEECKLACKVEKTSELQLTFDVDRHRLLCTYNRGFWQVQRAGTSSTAPEAIQPESFLATMETMVFDLLKLAVKDHERTRRTPPPASKPVPAQTVKSKTDAPLSVV